MEFFDTIDTFMELNCDDPKEVADLMAWHLARIFRGTFIRKLEREVEKLKS